MRTRRHGSRWLRLAALVLTALPIVFLIGCTMQQYPQSSLHPHADYARKIQHILELQVAWVVAIFVLVQGLLIVAVIKFRSRPGSPEPKPVHGNTVLEIAWTIAPAIILAMVAVPTVLTIYQTQTHAPPNALQVTVVGHQWWWEFQYPDAGVVTASEMVVPVGRPVEMNIKTADVLHSFWFPAMGGKRDAIGGRVNHMWFTPEDTGTYPGQCAELCGTSHANMRMLCKVVPQEEYDAWVAAQVKGPVEPDSGSIEAQGRDIFRTSGCIACHAIQGISGGTIGPNLTHVGSRPTLAGGMFPNTPEEMEAWITDAPARKPGAKMLSLEVMNMKQEQVKPIVAYLQSLK
jgi:cytochrome c oxidase subunit II